MDQFCTAQRQVENCVKQKPLRLWSPNVRLESGQFLRGKEITKQCRNRDQKYSKLNIITKQ